jgi:hypothetical protein
MKNIIEIQKYNYFRTMELVILFLHLINKNYII